MLFVLLSLLTSSFGNILFTYIFFRFSFLFCSFFFRSVTSCTQVQVTCTHQSHCPFELHFFFFMCSHWTDLNTRKINWSRCLWSTSQTDLNAKQQPYTIVYWTTNWLWENEKKEPKEQSGGLLYKRFHWLDCMCMCVCVCMDLWCYIQLTQRKWAKEVWTKKVRTKIKSVFSLSRY